MYQFLKGFTSNILPDAPQYFDEHQRLDLTKMKSYIDRIESDTERKKQIKNHDQITKKEQSRADDWMKENWPPEVG